MGPRAGLSTLLILGSIVLLVAIAVGNGMGNRVLRQVAHASDIEPTPFPVTVASPEEEEGGPNTLTLKRRHVTSVATDPAFPDPRITPEPTPLPTRPPTPRPTATPTPAPTAAPVLQTRAPYTSPPLAYPLVKHSPGATSTPDDLPTGPL